MTMTEKLTAASAALLIKIIKEAEYESANDMDDALMSFSAEERGNLTDLKKRGFVKTMADADTPNYTWCMLQEPAREIYNAIR